MPSHIDGSRVFLNEFDESVDALMLDLIGAINSTVFEPLEFWINSEGGDSTRAFSIVELMNLAKTKGKRVATYVLHDAHSAGSIVAIAGTPGMRKVAKNGNYLIHWGEVELTANSPLVLERITKANQRHFELVSNHYEHYTTMTPENLAGILKADHFYLPAEHAIGMGLADGYI